MHDLKKCSLHTAHFVNARVIEQRTCLPCAIKFSLKNIGLGGFTELIGSKYTRIVFPHLFACDGDIFKADLSIHFPLNGNVN